MITTATYTPVSGDEHTEECFDSSTQETDVQPTSPLARKYVLNHVRMYWWLSNLCMMLLVLVLVILQIKHAALSQSEALTSDVNSIVPLCTSLSRAKNNHFARV